MSGFDSLIRKFGNLGLGWQAPVEENNYYKQITLGVTTTVIVLSMIYCIIKDKFKKRRFDSGANYVIADRKHSDPASYKARIGALLKHVLGFEPSEAITNKIIDKLKDVHIEGQDPEALLAHSPSARLIAARIAHGIPTSNDCNILTLLEYSSELAKRLQELLGIEVTQTRYVQILQSRDKIENPIENPIVFLQLLLKSQSPLHYKVLMKLGQNREIERERQRNQPYSTISSNSRNSSGGTTPLTSTAPLGAPQANPHAQLLQQLSGHLGSASTAPDSVRDRVLRTTQMEVTHHFQGRSENPSLTAPDFQDQANRATRKTSSLRS